MLDVETSMVSLGPAVRYNLTALFLGMGFGWHQAMMFPRISGKVHSYSSVEVTVNGETFTDALASSYAAELART